VAGWDERSYQNWLTAHMPLTSDEQRLARIAFGGGRMSVSPVVQGLQNIMVMTLLCALAAFGIWMAVNG